MTDQEKLQYLFDRALITDVVTKFAVCIDMRDWPGMGALYTEMVEFDYPVAGIVGTFPRAGLIETAPRFFHRLTATQHISANHQIEIDGDSATCVSTLNARHYLAGQPGGEFQSQIGYYRNYLRREDSWRIWRSEQHVSWAEGNQGVFDHAAGGWAN